MTSPNSEPLALSKKVPACGKSRVRLRIRGFHIPSFKNGKVLFVTNPRNRALMKRIQDDFEQQLICSYPTVEGEMVTVEKLRSWIATSGPEDDSCHYLIACSWSFTTVSKGQEGANLEFAPTL